MRGRKLAGSASIFLHKLLGRKRIILRNNLDVLIVIPGDHAAKIKCLFGQLKNRRINFLLVIHNLKLKERLSLVINNVPFAKVDELANRNIFFKGIELRFGGKFGKNRDRKRAITLLEKLSPKILLTTTDPDSKVLPFIKVAKELNIKTITIQHGTYESAKGADFKSEMAFVWGDYYKKWFIEKLKKDNQSLQISGSPFFDQFKIENLKYEKLPINKLKILLLLTKYLAYEDYLNNEITKLIQYLSRIGVREILLRPHPWQKLDKDLFLNAGCTRIKEETGSLDASLKKSDIVVTLNTTAGFNALIKGKPLVYWKLPKFDVLPFDSNVPSAATAKEVAVLCLELARGRQKIDDKKRQQLLSDVFYRLDGKSGMRIVHFISKYLDDFSKNKIIVN